MKNDTFFLSVLKKPEHWHTFWFASDANIRFASVYDLVILINWI